MERDSIRPEGDLTSSERITERSFRKSEGGAPALSYQTAMKTID